MGLKLKLRAGESVYISGALIRNGSSSTELEILNKVPILREKDIMLESDIGTPCQQIYYLVQTLYLQPDSASELLNMFSKVSGDIVNAAPSLFSMMEDVHEKVSMQAYFDALKCAKKLIQHESTLVSHAKTN
jgi:flagellar biosynthesis repressor protein FlbT